MLPLHLIEFILSLKDKLETACFSTFVEDFNVRILAKRTIQHLGVHFVRFEYTLNLRYKPTNKNMIICYDTLCLIRNHDQKPCKYKIITRLVHDAINLQHTLENKEMLIECQLMSYKSLTQYKNEVFKLRKVLGSNERFYRLLECYSKTP